MHVVLATGIYPPETGGPATFVPALAAELRVHGISVTVVTYGNDSTVRSKDWRVEVVSRSGGTLRRYLRYCYAVKRVARSADVVFLQGAFSEGLPGALGALLARCSTVLRVPGDFAWEGWQREQASATTSLERFLEKPKPMKWRIVFALEAWVACRARFVITPSRYLQRLSQAWGVKKDRQKVIYNSVELEKSLPEREALRKAFGIAADQIVLLSNARGVPWKRVDFLLDVLRDLPPCYQLIHVGEGPEIPAWKRKAEQLGLTDRVHFKGRVSYLDVQRWAKAADAFVLPSLYEGFPHVAIEAACQGLPCFLSDQGGNPEAADVYPERIQILPYDDRAAWLKALWVIPAPFPAIAPQPFSAVAEAYADLLSAAV
jgi:glycosyltransferase involved in cell wall biosynthesis